MGIGDVVRSYLAAFATGDVDTVAAHVSDDFVNEQTAALGQGCRGREVYRERLASFLTDMAGLRYEIEDLVVSGDRCMVAYTMTARWKGTRPISLRGAQRLVVRNGEIVARTDYWDAASFLLQADPSAPSALRTFGIEGLGADDGR